jgi:uncharacterized protein
MHWLARVPSAATTALLAAGVAALVLAGPKPPPPRAAVALYQPLPFHQDWSDRGLINFLDDWSHVPGIRGYDGIDEANSQEGLDPRELVSDTTLTSQLAVLPRQRRPDGLTDVPLAHFIPGGGSGPGRQVAAPIVGLRPQMRFPAPFLLLHLDTRGHPRVVVSYDLVDLDGSRRDAVQPVALQYRVGEVGPFTNVDGAYVADATEGPRQRGKVTNVQVELPLEAGDQAQLQLRIISANARGPDEWVGVANITVEGRPP